MDTTKRKRVIWIDDLSELQFYNQTIWADCYCDLLVEANDLILQAPVTYSPSGQYTLMVEVMQPDGLIVFEDATAYFEWYVFQGVNGNYYMNIRANRFSPAMCANSCFILRVTIKRIETFSSGEEPVTIERIIFQKFTERYCVDNCCLVAKSIDINVIDPEAGEYESLDYQSTEYNT